MIYSQGKRPGGTRRTIGIRLVAVGLGLLLLGGGVLLALDAMDIAPFGVRRGDNELLRLWGELDYPAVRDTARTILAERPLNGEALTFGGFAEFYIGIESVQADEQLESLDRSIVLLRKALHVPHTPLAAERDYVLAKAYFHKSDEYVDLSIRYMERSLERGYEALDSRTYLALGHARLEMHEESVFWFEQAVENAPAGEVNAIRIRAAESYVAIEEYDSAMRLLDEAIRTLDDDFLVLMARNRLASVLILDGRLSEAESVIVETIQRYPESADAYYYLGMVYDQTDRHVQARVQWRLARDIDPNHTEALRRLAN